MTAETKTQEKGCTIKLWMFPEDRTERERGGRDWEDCIIK